MNEIVITQEAGKVSCDFEGIKAALNATLNEYKGVVFTEDSKKDAKAIVADLRKNKKAFADRIRDVKAEYMKPYEEFYTKAQELVQLFDEPIDYINGQLLEFELKRVEEKKALINELYNTHMAGKGIDEYIEIEKIYNPKWENATYKEKAIVQDMNDIMAATISGIELIKSMKSDVEQAALDMFKAGTDANDCIMFINRHEQEKKEILERERERVKREEEERIRQEERQRIAAEQEAQKAFEAEKQAAVEVAKQEAIEALIPDSIDEAEEEYTYIIKAGAEAIKTLEMYMDSIGIEYQQLPNELPY